MMKDKIKNNIGLKILAVVFAVFLWWAVLNIDDPLDSKKYSVNVNVTNPEVVTNAGKSYQIIEDTKEVTVTVKARRKVLDEIKKTDIIATADFREMQDGSVPIRISINGYEGKYEDVSATPRNIIVNVENTQKKTFPITAVAIGSPRDGYVVGDMIVSPKTVDISGPESLIKKISKVVAKVDVSEMKDSADKSVDADIQTNLIYYDAAENEIDKTLLTSNCDKNGVTVSVDIWKTKKLNLHFDTSKIKPAKGYAVSGIEVEPEMIEVAAKPEELEGMTTLEISAEALVKQNISANEELTVDISEYLPKGVTLADEGASNVAVRILVEKAGTKSIQLPTGSIEVLNLSDKLQLQYSTLEVALTFTGADEVLENLTKDSIQATIDLAEYNTKGTYEVPIKITSMPANCIYEEEVKVKIILSKK